MIIKLIAAMAKNRTIGNQNTLPRNYPEDMKYFRTMTSGKAIVMGRKTYESIGRPLPNRRNIILTSRPIEGLECYDNIPAMIQQLEKEGVEDIFVIWGASIYAEFIPLADLIYLTEIQKEYDGDTFFPVFEDGFEEIQRDIQGELAFVVYKKK